MRRAASEADGAVEITELRRQGIAALPDPQMLLFPMRSIVTRTGALANVTGQASGRLAVDEHLVRAIGPDPLPGAVLQAKSLHMQLPAVAFDLERHHSCPIVSARCSTSAAGPMAA
jgi:hypothetical protein